ARCGRRGDGAPDRGVRIGQQPSDLRCQRTCRLGRGSDGRQESSPIWRRAGADGTRRELGGRARCLLLGACESTSRTVLSQARLRGRGSLLQEAPGLSTPLKQVVEPLNDGAENGSGAVGQGELVVAGGQATPLLHVAIAAFDDVATPVRLGVQPDGSASAGPAVAAMLLLVAGLGDDGLDPATAEGLAGGPRGVGLITAQHVRSCAWPARP